MTTIMRNAVQEYGVEAASYVDDAMLLGPLASPTCHVLEVSGGLPGRLTPRNEGRFA